MSRTFLCAFICGTHVHTKINVLTYAQVCVKYNTQQKYLIMWNRFKIVISRAGVICLPPVSSMTVVTFAGSGRRRFCNAIRSCHVTFSHISLEYQQTLTFNKSLAI